MQLALHMQVHYLCMHSYRVESQCSGVLLEKIQVFYCLKRDELRTQKTWEENDWMTASCRCPIKSDEQYMTIRQ